MSLPLRDVEQPGVRLIDGRIVRNALEDHRVGHCAPVHLPAFPEVPGAAIGLIHHHSQAFVDIHKPSNIPQVVLVGFNKVKLLQAHFLQARDHALVELRVRSRAPVLYIRTIPVVHAHEIRLEHDTVGYGNPGLRHGHEDLPGQREALSQFGRFVHLVRHVGAPDKDSLGIALDERVESEVSLGETQGSPS